MIEDGGRVPEPACVHLLKLCVGIDTVDHLAESQARRLAQRRASGEAEELWHMTRHVPRRADELVAGGSLYWVIKGFIRVRQRITRIDVLDRPVNGKRCRIMLANERVRTELQARRPHQGWRYLAPRDAPTDLALSEMAAEGEALPAELSAELRALGLL